jgi:hypothetical protein
VQDQSRKIANVLDQGSAWRKGGVQAQSEVIGDLYGWHRISSGRLYRIARLRKTARKCRLCRKFFISMPPERNIAVTRPSFGASTTASNSGSPSFSSGLGVSNSDPIRIAGGAKCLASPEHQHEREFVLEQIRTSIRLHETKLVILVLHSDCGAYGGLIDRFGGNAARGSSTSRGGIATCRGMSANGHTRY